MSVFTKNLIKFFKTELENFSINDNDLFKPIGGKIDFDYNNQEKLKNKLLEYFNFYKTNSENIKKVLYNNFLNIVDLQKSDDLENLFVNIYCSLGNYCDFVRSGSKIYKFNESFLNDYLNFDINFDKVVSTQSLRFSETCIMIHAENLYKSPIDEHIYNLVFVNKIHATDGKKNEFNILQFSFHDINTPNKFISINKKTDEDFDLINAYKNKGFYEQDYEIEESINHDEIIGKVIKLIIYIQSSNIDLRKMQPLLSNTNSRKERDRAMQYNIVNDSLLPHFKVGYSWNKLPIYTMDEWSVRGHFRLQPCGEQRQNHKVIFIEPQVRKRHASKNIELSSINV